jgi:glycosyltransferase involved in cell wall biosynthesis
LAQQRLRVVVVTTSFPLSRDSVSGVFVECLVRSLPADFDVSVIAPCGVEPHPRSAHIPFTLLTFRYAPRPWQRLAHRPGGIPVALRENRLLYLLLPGFLVAMFIAVVRAGRTAAVLHANWSISGVIVGFVGWLLGRPVITTLRGEDVTRARRSLISRLLLRCCLHFSDQVVAVSESITQHLRDDYPRYATRVQFVPNGVRDELLRIPVERSRHGGLRLLTVGSLIPRKGIETIIRSLAICLPETRVNLTVVGAGPLKSHLERLVHDLGCTGHVQFVGAVPPGQLRPYFAQADVFILASFSEGRPNVVLEAMAAALPVVASRIEGVTELIRNGKEGLLFDAGDPRQLAEKIGRFSSDPAMRYRLGRSGRNYITRNGLSWTNAGTRYGDIYRYMTDRSEGSR